MFTYRLKKVGEQQALVDAYSSSSKQVSEESLCLLLALKTIFFPQLTSIAPEKGTTKQTRKVRGGKYSEEEIRQLKAYFAEFIEAGVRPTIPECRPYLLAYPNVKGRTDRDIRDKMRHFIPKDN